MPAALVIDGHPNPDSLTAAMAGAYAAGHGDARVLPLRDLDFDVHMRFGYRAHMPLEPDLEDAKHAMHAAKRIVVVTPMWWGSTPALLKGFFDRALLPQEEYRYSRLGLPQGLLAGRRGRVLLLADTPAIAVPVLGIHAAGQIRRHTLAFCGVRAGRVNRFLGVKDASVEKIQGWLTRAERFGERDGRRDARAPQPPIRTHTFADSMRAGAAHSLAASGERASDGCRLSDASAATEIQ